MKHDGDIREMEEETDVVVRKKPLRSGYTTGACAAAAAKAAAIIALGSVCGARPSGKMKQVEIPFPGGGRVAFRLHSADIIRGEDGLMGRASVIKDAGDDPDATNRAEIVAEVSVRKSASGVQAGADRVVIRGGTGVGKVTKPGLPMPVGEAAINPVPRRMITEAVQEAMKENPAAGAGSLEVTISVPEGEQIAKKTLNHRLGIVGGISILGTSGIVRPLSAEAWTASITASMNVAKALGLDEVVLSAGRISERIHQEAYGLPEESYVMMGDYLEFSLRDAREHGFQRIHLCAQWAKMIKTALSTPQTHVRHGALDTNRAVELLHRLGADPSILGHEFNTAREIFEQVQATYQDRGMSLFREVCKAAKAYAETITGDIPVVCHLVSYEGRMVTNSA